MSLYAGEVKECLNNLLSSLEVRTAGLRHAKQTAGLRHASAAPSLASCPSFIRQIYTYIERTAGLSQASSRNTSPQQQGYVNSRATSYEEQIELRHPNIPTAGLRQLSDEVTPSSQQPGYVNCQVTSLTTDLRHANSRVTSTASYVIPTA